MNTQTTILALDPSSTALGVALLDAGRSGWEIEFFGVAKVRGTRPSHLRCLGLAAEAAALCRRHLPAVVVIEVPSGKVAGRHRGGGAGLSIYGMAVGAVLAATASEAGRQRVWPILENVWTGGKPKSERLSLIATQWVAYRQWWNEGRDSGGDAGDAIGLACWAATALQRTGRARLYPGVTTRTSLLGSASLDHQLQIVQEYVRPQSGGRLGLAATTTQADSEAAGAATDDG